MPRAALATFAVLLCAVSAGCGARGSGAGRSSVEEGLTDAKARQLVYDHLRKTLAELPPGARWSLHSDADREPFDPGRTMVCSDDETATAADTPVNVQLDYWLTGVPHGQEARYYELVRRVRKSWGWVERPGANDLEASYQRPEQSEGYLYLVTNAGNGPGSVGVAVSSPCFWTKDDATVDPPLRDAQPRVIERSGD